MPDWPRKHCQDLIDALERMVDRESAPDSALHLFSPLATRARAISKHPSTSNEQATQELIIDWCRICQGAACFPCAGRGHWTEPCFFLASR